MKDLSYSALLGMAVGGYLSRFLRGAWHWDLGTWALIAFFTAYVYVIWKLDNRNEVDG